MSNLVKTLLLYCLGIFTGIILDIYLGIDWEAFVAVIALWLSVSIIVEDNDK